MSETSEVIICKQCEGTGLVGHSELQDYHKGEYRYWNTVCGICKGTGRLKKVVTITEEITPYDNSEVTMLILKQKND